MPAATPTKSAREVVAGAERQDGHRRCVLELGAVEEGEHPSNRAVSSADEDSEPSNTAERAQRFLGSALREIDHLKKIYICGERRMGDWGGGGTRKTCAQTF